jgi:hypothetical protein
VQSFPQSKQASWERGFTPLSQLACSFLRWCFQTGVAKCNNSLSLCHDTIWEIFSRFFRDSLAVAHALGVEPRFAKSLAEAAIFFEYNRLKRAFGG